MLYNQPKIPLKNWAVCTTANGQSPSDFASLVTSPLREEAFRGRSPQKGAPQRGELAEPARPEGLCGLQITEILSGPLPPICLIPVPAFSSASHAAASAAVTSSPGAISGTPGG